MVRCDVHQALCSIQQSLRSNSPIFLDARFQAARAAPLLIAPCHLPALITRMWCCIKQRIGPNEIRIGKCPTIGKPVWGYQALLDHVLGPVDQPRPVSIPRPHRTQTSFQICVRSLSSSMTLQVFRRWSFAVSYSKVVLLSGALGAQCGSMRLFHLAVRSTW